MPPNESHTKCSADFYFLSGRTRRNIGYCVQAAGRDSTTPRPERVA